MKRKIVNQRLNQGYGKAVGVMALILALGAVLGTVIATILSEDMLLNSKMVIDSLNKHTISNIAMADVFTSAFISDTKTLIILWGMCFSLFFLPFVFLTVLIKGMCIGFSAAAFVKIYGLKGIFTFGLLTVPVNIIMIPTVIFLAVFCIHNAIRLKKIKKYKNNIEKKHIINQCFAVFLGIIIISFICGGIESYLVTNIILPMIL